MGVCLFLVGQAAVPAANSSPASRDNARDPHAVDRRGWATRRLAEDRRLPAHVLDELAAHADPFVRRAVACNPSTSAETLKRLVVGAWYGVRVCLAGHRTAPLEVLWTLAAEADHWVVQALEHNPNAPPELVLEAKRRSQVRSAEARERILAARDRKPHPADRLRAAADPETSPEALRELARDASSASLRAGLAANPSTPADVLLGLAGDEDIGVRIRVAKNPNTPAEALVRMARDRDVDVRWRVAAHRSTPPAQLRRLSWDRNGRVQVSLLHNPHTPIEVQPRLLRRIVKQKEPSIRHAAAGHERTTARALRRLASDPWYWVRVTVARNANTPIDAVADLSRDAVPRVREAVVENPNAPPELRALAAKQPPVCRKSCRFVKLGDGAVLDTQTHLLWLEDANCFGKMHYRDALRAVGELGDGRCGLTDGSSPGQWRLPSEAEWRGLLIRVDLPCPARLHDAKGDGCWSEGNPFAGVELGYYWMASPVGPDWLSSVELKGGSKASSAKSHPVFVWPVRERQ